MQSWFMDGTSLSGGGKFETRRAKVNSMLRAILFDFDGTIVLSEPLHYAAFAEVLAARGIDLSERAYYERYVALTDRECLERVVADRRRPDLRAELPALLAAKARSMAERYSRGVPPCPGVQSFVAVAAGRAALAVVSGALRAEITAVLERIRLASFFDVVISAEDVRAGKPDPEGYRLALERLRARRMAGLLPSECLAVEDTPKGIEAARGAGLRVLALPHTVGADELAAADSVVAGYDRIVWSQIDALFT
jgi:beta-phosphoglucomutase